MAVPRTGANLGLVEAADLVAVAVLLVEEAGAPRHPRAIVHTHLGGGSPRARLDDLLGVPHAVHPVLVVVAPEVLLDEDPVEAAAAAAPALRLRFDFRFDIVDFRRRGVLGFDLGAGNLLLVGVESLLLSLMQMASSMRVSAHSTLGMAVPRTGANLGLVEAADLVAVFVLLVEEAGAPRHPRAIVHTHLGGGSPRARLDDLLGVPHAVHPVLVVVALEVLLDEDPVEVAAAAAPALRLRFDFRFDIVDFRRRGVLGFDLGAGNLLHVRVDDVLLSMMPMVSSMRVSAHSTLGMAPC